MEQTLLIKEVEDLLNLVVLLLVLLFRFCSENYCFYCIEIIVFIVSRIGAESAIQLSTGVCCVETVPTYLL